jgi:Protein of unknown function (DUF3006)
MRVQLEDSFEDNEMPVLLPYPEGRQSFVVPRELLPEDARAGDGFKVRFAHAREETRRIAAENRRLLDNHLGRNDG